MTIVRAARLDQYPPLRGMSEAELLRAHRPAIVRMEPCACGGVLVQHQGEAVMDVVTAHNATPEHVAWGCPESPGRGQ